MKKDFVDEVSAEDEVAVLLGEQGVGDDYFLERGLVRFDDARSGDLVTVQVDDDGRVHELVAGACDAWMEMKCVALAEGVELELVSAFRSVERQAQIVRGKLQRGLGVTEIFAVSAPPGYSEHHTGRAVDISTPGYEALEEEFEESVAFGWLVENAGRFGFSMTYGRENAFGFLYEPWHWVWESSCL